jgi:transcriptional regulator with XRE-family HTH domain
MYPNLKLQIFMLGIHQNHIARALGIDESVLSKIIHGYREPSDTQRKQLAGYLKVEESWLFERIDGTYRNPAPLVGAPARERKDGAA